MSQSSGWIFDRAELVHHIAENAGDVIFEDEFFLLHALEQLAAQAVHRLALLVHDVVILEQMFAGFEVLGFHGFLRGSMRRVISRDSIGMPSSMPSRCSKFETHSLAKMRIRSSSSER